ncbi:MAG: response regulator transcription factor [Lachnospiraceae bacterium]|nr:response regulator transcription factor [Lachnospiraceae bacterium]
MTGKTVLLVEDNPNVMRNNIAVLKLQGAVALSAANLTEARSILALLLTGKRGAEVTAPPDVAVIDIMLPDGSGLDLLREIRSVSSLPILLLTAKGESRDVVTGLSLGADDYLAKPYDLDVFTARIDALLRRAHTMSDSIFVGLLRFDLISNKASYDGEDLLLTQKEFALLLLLAQNEKKTLTPDTLFQKVWGQPPNGDTAAIRFQISGLKKKIAAATENILIETTRGEGYCMTMH